MCALRLRDISRKCLTTQNRDGNGAVAKKSLAYGVSGTMLAIYLKTIVINELAIVILLTAVLADSIAFNPATIRYSLRFGRRKILITHSVLMFISGCAFLLTRAYPVMLLGAALGLISVSSADSGLFLGNSRENPRAL